MVTAVKAIGDVEDLGKSFILQERPGRRRAHAGVADHRQRTVAIAADELQDPVQKGLAATSTVQRHRRCAVRNPFSPPFHRGTNVDEGQAAAGRHGVSLLRVQQIVIRR